MSVSYLDVRDDIERAAGLGAQLEPWFERRNPVVTAHALGFVHRVLLTVTTADVREARSASQHALGDIDVSENAPCVRDAFTDWALTYLFHDLLETSGQVPTWQQFLTYITSRRSRGWWNPVLDHCRKAGVKGQPAARAARWRLGTFWNSAIREVELLAGLRHDHGLNAKYHVLADVELKIDGWVDDTVLYMRVPNDYVSRKLEASTRFDGTTFRLREVKVDRQGAGVSWMVSDDEIAEVARFVRGSAAPDEPCRR